MEIASKPSHGQEEICREKDHEQAGSKPQGARHEFPGRKDNADCGAAVGQKVHDNDGIELHGQHFHGHDAEMLRLLIHLLMLVLVRLVDLERRHTLQVFQKGAAQLCVLVPVFCQYTLGDLLHHHDGTRNQRNADQKHHGRAQAPCRNEHDEQSDRRQECIEKLWHILAKIAFQLINSLDRLLHQLCGSHLLAVTHAEL